MNSFGERLRLIRKEKGMSLLDLSLAVGTSKSLLSRYENGLVDPALDTAISFANYFNVSLNWIAGVDSKRDMHDYGSVIDRCIKENVSPEQLNIFIDALKG